VVKEHFLEHDKLQNIMAFSYLKKPTCKVIAQNESAIYLYDTYSDISLLCTDTLEAGIDLLSHSSKPRCLILNRPLLLPYIKEKWNLTNRESCFQAVYLKDSIDVPSRLNISLATDSEIEVMMNTYQFAKREEFERTRERDMLFAAHANGEFVGYIGEHGEGSMGMLHILQPYRGKGYAFELESFMIAQKLKRGQISYCHIIESNLASYHLQQKLGLQFAKDKVFWTFDYDNQ
jgi:GNAT superfamily N-acetyltransferase